MTLARDPLKRFFASLDKMARLGDTVRLALPAHGNPFNDLAGRCTQIREHHEGRLDKIRSASVDFGRPATVMEIASRVFSARAQGPMADSETYAHLEHLRLAGQMSRRDVDGLARYTVE
jgi:glyoxylase-like metal-dependent hydrolase (beta-lactamase superfamily II)